MLHNTVTSRPKLRLFPARDDEAVTFAPEATQTVRRPTRETPQVPCAEIGQFMLFPVGPEILHRIELGRIGWQAAGDDLTLQGCEVWAAGGGTREGRASPDDQQLARQRTLQMAEEPGWPAGF